MNIFFNDCNSYIYRMFRDTSDLFLLNLLLLIFARKKLYIHDFVLESRSNRERYPFRRYHLPVNEYAKRETKKKKKEKAKIEKEGRAILNTAVRTRRPVR